MGVQPPPKKKDRASKISDLEKNLRNMQMQLDELRRGVEADDEHDEDCVPRGQRGRRSSKPQQGAKGRHVPHPEDDDDEEIPVKLEKELAAQPASDGSETLTGRKRKQDVDVSGPDESFSGDLIRPVNRRAEREADRVAVQPAAAKRARLYCDLQGIYKIPSEPTKDRTAQLTYQASIESSFHRPSTSEPKVRRPAPPFKPLPDKPLPTPQWATSSAQPETTKFKLPSSSPLADPAYASFVETYRIETFNTATASTTAAPNRSDQRNRNAFIEVYGRNPFNPAADPETTVPNISERQDQIAIMETFRVKKSNPSNVPAIAAPQRSDQQDRNVFQAREGSNVNLSASNVLPPQQQPSDPSYAEIELFEFKLIVSHADRPGKKIEYHNSSALKENMSAFWTMHDKQLERWEEAAGANRA
jgi:hypothetical protein